MVSIKARLNDVETKLTPPLQVDYAAVLNEGRQRVERRAVYRREKLWEPLEAELITELGERLARAKEALRSLDDDNASYLNWQTRQITESIFPALAQTIDELKDCRNKNTDSTATENRPAVLAGGWESWVQVIAEAERTLTNAEV